MNDPLKLVSNSKLDIKKLQSKQNSKTYDRVSYFKVQKNLAGNLISK